MDKAEYIFYKLAQQKKDDQEYSEITIPGSTFKPSQGPDADGKQYAVMSLAKNMNDAHKYKQPSLINPGTYALFGVDPASGYKNSPGWPDAAGINYNRNQAANLGLRFWQQYPEQVKDYTRNPETGKKNTFNTAYGKAGEEGQDYFRYGKGIFQQDKVIKGKTDVVPDQTVRIPKPTYNMNIDVPESTYKDELVTPKPNELTNAPDRSFKPSKLKAQVGRENIDIPGLISDVANIGVGHWNADAAKRAFRPEGAVSGSFIQSGKELAEDVAGGKNKFRVSPDIANDPNKIADKMMTTWGKEYQDYVQRISDDKSIPENERKELINAAQVHHDQLIKEIKDPELRRKYIWDPKVEGGELPKDIDKAQTVFNMYTKKKVDNPKTADDYAQNIYAETGTPKYEEGNIFSPFTMGNTGATVAKNFGQTALNLSRGVGVAGGILGTALSGLYNIGRSIIKGTPDNMVHSTDVEAQANAIGKQNELLKGVPENLKKDVAKRLGMYNTMPWNEQEMGKVPTDDASKQQYQDYLNRARAFYNY